MNGEDENAIVCENKNVYVINGSGGTGKDTFVSMVSKLVNCQNYSSVDDIKEAARLIGWDGSKDEKSRKFLSDLKFLSTNYNDYPFQSILNRIDKFYYEEPEESILFIHIRETREIQRLRALHPEVLTILITNKNIEQITSNEADAGVMNLDYDYVICNDEGLLELNEKAKQFVENRKNEWDNRINQTGWGKDE